MSDLKPGDQAPDFTLPTDGGGTLSLKQLRGKPVILYFYPKDALPDFTRTGATVIGVSRDSAASHDKFKRKHSLSFPLAADVDGKVCEAYGTWVEKSMYGRKYMGIERATFLIDGKGAIRRIWRKVKVTGHVEEVLAAVRAL